MSASPKKARESDLVTRFTPKVTQQMIELYDDYTHLTLDRRRFFDHLTKVAGGTAAAPRVTATAIVPRGSASGGGAAQRTCVVLT